MFYDITVRGTDQVVSIDSDKIADDNLMAYIFKKGLDAVLHRGRTTKLGGKNTFANADAYAKAAVEIFMAQVEDLYSGRTRVVGGTKKAKGADAAVQTEMLRLAKIKLGELVKSGAYSDDKGKIIKWSNVSAAERTKGAKALIEQDPEVFRKAAEANLSAAANVTLGDKPKLTLSEDPKLVKARTESAAKKKAAKEGKTPPPAPPQKGKGKATQAAKH